MLYDLYREVIINTKICIYCKEEKILSQFSKHSHNRDGYNNICKTCSNHESRVRRQRIKTAPPKPDACQSCLRPGLDLVLDHDHKTDEFRGWICEPCNHNLGHMNDDPQLIENQRQYAIRSLYAK